MKFFLKDIRWSISLLSHAWTPWKDRLICRLQKDAKKTYDLRAKHALDLFIQEKNSLQFFQYSENNVPSITVIVIFFNKAHLSLACLQSLLKSTFTKYELIIVDNNSEDQTSKVLELTQGAKIIRNQENIGYLKACNQAARHSKGKYLLFLNNDTILFQETLGAALNELEQNPKAGAVGARIINLDGKLQEAGNIIWNDGTCEAYGRKKNPHSGEFMYRRAVDYCSGAFLMTPRFLFEKVGGFDPVYAPAYYEESDYCTNIREMGYEVIYEPKVSLYHYEFGSASSSSWAIQQMLKNQKIFVKKHVAFLSKQYKKSPNHVLAARSADTRKRILFLEDRIPFENLGAGFPRTLQTLKSLSREDCFITFYPMLKTEESNLDEVYSLLPQGIEILLGKGEALLKAFLNERRGHYQFLWVGRPHNMETVHRLKMKHSHLFEGVRIIYDAEAIFSNRDQQVPNFASLPQWKQILRKERSLRLQKEEFALGKSANHILAVSKAEKSQFEACGYSNVSVLGHVLEIERSKIPFSDRKDILFLGAIHYHPSPNSDSVLWFAQEVLPLIQKKLGRSVKFLIAGVNHSAEVERLASDSIQLLGRIPHLKALYDRCRIFVAPTRFAAGIPHKVHQAAALGIPCVTTQLIASQLSWSHGQGLLCASTTKPEEFAKLCIELYTQEQLWNQIQSQAYQRIQTDCSPDIFQESIRNIIRAQDTRV